jgi:hypothetical protein
MKTLETILLFTVVLWIVPIMPLIMLLSKVHEYIHRNDKPFY